MRGLKKNLMGRGQTDKHTDTQTHRQTCPLLDQLDPEGRVGEKRHSEFASGMTSGPIGYWLVLVQFFNYQGKPLIENSFPSTGNKVCPLVYTS